MRRMQAGRETGRFALAALALGGISYCGSEALFWNFPPEGITALDGALTVLAYSLVAACVLAAVIWSGIGGWRAVFLGGAIGGWLIEGVVVDTMYDAFPFQIVWTPLAWHAAVTGLGIFGVQRLLAAGPLWRYLAFLLVAGLLGAGFAGFWPTERAVLPPPPAIFLYQLASGAVAVAGFAVFGRLGALPRPPCLMQLAVPCLALLLWLGKSVFDPRPERLLLPLLLAVTLWAMRRLGTGAPVSWRPAPLRRDALFLIVPLTVASIASFLILGTPGFQANVVAVLVLTPLGLCLWLWLVWRAFRQRAP